MRTSSSSRRFSSPWVDVWRTWAMIANPSAAASTIARAFARVARGEPARSNRRHARSGSRAGPGTDAASSSGSGVVGSGSVSLMR